jgi:hypothetical protein
VERDPGEVSPDVVSEDEEWLGEISHGEDHNSRGLQAGKQFSVRRGVQVPQVELGALAFGQDFAGSDGTDDASRDGPVVVGVEPGRGFSDKKLLGGKEGGVMVD